MKVSEVMTSNVVTVAVDDSFRKVLQAMFDNRVSGLPVVERDGSLIGIVTEADLVAKEAHPESHRLLGALVDMIGSSDFWWRKSDGLTAGELMSTPVLTCAPDDDLRFVARRMLAHHVKRMPVTDGHGHLLAIVSRADLLKAVNRSDERICADVYELVHGAADGDADQIRFSVHDGVVALEGQVSRASHARTLVAALRAVPGVIEVVSNLQERDRQGLEALDAIDRMRHSGVGVDDQNIWHAPDLPSLR